MLTTPENKLEIEGFRPALSKHLSLESEPYAFMPQVVLVSSITLDYYYTATERLVDFLCSIVRSNLC